MLFQRLLKIHRSVYSNGQEVRIRLEDFATEALAGILLANKEWLKEFCTWLNIKGEDIYLDTQCCHSLNNPNDNRIDMFIETEEEIVFIEFKVHSSEGYEQLNDYRKLLIRESALLNKKPRLFYITKYYDPKELSVYADVNFEQKHWSDIGHWISQYDKDNLLIKEFLTFLKSHQMSSSNALTVQDLAAFSRLHGIYLFMAEFFDRLNPLLQKHFNASFAKKTWEAELKNYHFYGMLSHSFLKTNHYTEFSVRFQFPPEETPFLNFSFWIDQKDNVLPSFNETIKSYKIDQGIDQFEYGNEAGSGLWVSRSILLTELLDEGKPQIELLINRSDEELAVIANFIKNTPNLPWVPGLLKI